MGTYNISYALQDTAGHKVFGGFTIDSSAAPTLASVITFCNEAIVPYSDGALVSVAVREARDITDTTPSGQTNIERKGMVKLSKGAARFSVTVPALKQAAINPAGVAPSELTEACENQIRTSFCTLSGYSPADVTVKASYSDKSYTR